MMNYNKEFSSIKGNVTSKDIQELNKLGKKNNAWWGTNPDKEFKWHLNGDPMNEVYNKQENNCVFLIMNIKTGMKYIGESIALPRICDGLSEVFGENYGYNIGCRCIEDIYHNIVRGIEEGYKKEEGNEEADLDALSYLYNYGTEDFKVKLLAVNVMHYEDREKLVREWLLRFNPDELYNQRISNWTGCKCCHIDYDPSEEDGREEYWAKGVRSNRYWY